MATSHPHPPGAASSPKPDEDRRLVVVAASAGGLKPLTTIVSALPADFPTGTARVFSAARRSPYGCLWFADEK